MIKLIQGEWRGAGVSRVPKLVTVRLRPSGGIKTWLRGRKLADSLAASWLLGYLVYRVYERLCRRLDVERVLRPVLPGNHPFEKKPDNLEPWETRGCVMPDAVELVVDGDVSAEEVARIARETVEDVLEDVLKRGRETPWRCHNVSLYEPLEDWWERTSGRSAARVELPPGLIQVSAAVVDLEEPDDEEAYREAVRRVASLVGTRAEVMDARGSGGQPCSVCGTYPTVGDREFWEELSERLPPQLLKRWEGGFERLCAACLLKRYFGTHVIRSWYLEKISWIPSTAEVAITPVKVGILNRWEELKDDGGFREAALGFLREVLPEQLRQIAHYLRCVKEVDRAGELEEAAKDLKRDRLEPEGLPEDVRKELHRLTPKAPRLDEELGDVEDSLIEVLLCVEGRFWYDPEAPGGLRELLEAGDLENLYTPYYALLKLDGDRMGELFSRDPETTRGASRATIEFGLKAMRIVHGHYGVLLYCGGDDVFAALPLHTALDCAFELEETFRESLKKWKGTCSAGLAVVHHLHPLRDAIDLAYRLEKRAKEAGRNRLAVGLYRRNAPERVAVLKWEADGKRPWGLLFELADLVSRRAAYHLPRDWWEGWWEELDEPKNLLRSLLGYVALRHRGEGADEGEIVGLVERIAEVVGKAGPEDGDPGAEVGRALEIALELRSECPAGGNGG